MQNLYKDLEEILFKDKQLISEDGKLLKNKVTEIALKNDKDFISSLFKNKAIKNHFFFDIEGFTVFDKEKFIRFVNNKEFLPDSFTTFKNKMGLYASGEYLHTNTEVSLVWAYKDCVLEGGAEKEGETRDEIFYNEILAPDEIDRLLDKKVFTSFQEVSKSGDKKPETFEGKNLLFKGNSLFVLSSLLTLLKRKVKLIYIDPPFNREGDTFYNDKFKHSSWLTYIKNRLVLAKELLREDGFICVHLDDTEMAYCRVLMDEIFGRSNYRNTIALTTNKPSGFKATGDSIFSTANYILIYSKSGKDKCPIKKVYVKTDYDDMYNQVLKDRKKPIKEWEWESIKSVVANECGFSSYKKAKEELGPEEIKARIAKFALNNADRVFRLAAIRGGARQKRINTINKSKENKNIVFIHPNEDVEAFFILNGQQILFYEKKISEIEGKIVPAQLITDVWTDISWTGIASEGRVTLKNGKKPEKLMSRLIEMLTEKDDYVLDYHMGSGTTPAVAHKMGRRYVGIEQLDYGDNSGYKRLRSVIEGESTGVSDKFSWKGGGSFVYVELMELNERFIADIEKARSTKKLLSIYKKMKTEAFFRYDIDLSKFDEKQFKELHLGEQKQVLFECLDKNHLYVNYSEIEDITYKVSAEDKKLNRLFYTK